MDILPIAYSPINQTFKGIVRINKPRKTTIKGIRYIKQFQHK